MAVRVGIDLVSVDTVRESIREHGDRYLERIYTEAELRDCLGAEGTVPERLAARFAAKEATIKVLRPTDQPIPWRNIEVIRHPSGWVELELSGYVPQPWPPTRAWATSLSACRTRRVSLRPW